MWGKNYKLITSITKTEDIYFTFNSLSEYYTVHKTWPCLGHQNPCHGKQQTAHWHTCNELTTYQVIPTQITSQPKFQNSTQLSAMTLIGRTIVRICLDEAKAWSASQRIIIFTCLCLECLEANWCVLTIISA